MAVAGGVPWWVILLAVLAGILVLALLVFILWKVSEGTGSLQQDVSPPRGAGCPEGAVPCWTTLAVPCYPYRVMPRRAAGPLLRRAMLCRGVRALLCHAVLHRAKQCRGVRCHGAVPRCAVPSLTFSLPPQCGFFKRSSQTSRYTTNYYRARRRLQPSEADKQALEGQR